MSGCGAYLRRLTTGLAGCALRRGEPIVAAVPSWSASPSPLCVATQPRWRACYATAAPTLNPLDQVAIPEPETTPQGSQQYKKKKKDPRFKFQEKGVFGENLYTKGFSENLHISPHKLNDMVKVLRGQSIHDAIIQCQMSVKKAAKLCEEAIVECRKKAIDQNGVDPQKLLIGELVIGSMFWGAKAGEGYGTCQPAGSVAVPHHVVSAALGSSQSGGVQGGTPQHHTADVRWRAQTTVVQGSSPISSPRPTPSSLQRRDVGREGPVPEAQLHACARAVRSSAQVPLPPHDHDAGRPGDGGAHARHPHGRRASGEAACAADDAGGRQDAGGDRCMSTAPLRGPLSA
uniref:50S ribosomal protein L22, chloroplastic n=1 Tax=Auxenochlorella protothecoides TaxID=3075 RepID=A0A1D2A388_AUXPR